MNDGTIHYYCDSGQKRRGQFFNWVWMSPAEIVLLIVARVLAGSNSLAEEFGRFREGIDLVGLRDRAADVGWRLQQS